ncbi:hypothetical protein CCP1ISM_160002 [Azospirillaceae bacterium]
MDTISVILLIIILMMITSALTYIYFVRKINRHHLKKSTMVDDVKPNLSTLPDLRNHRFFNEATNQMRISESSVNKLEKVLAVWTIRNYRNTFLEIVNDMYKNENNLDISSTKFRSKIDSSLVAISATIRHKLVDEFKFPSAVYAKWQKYKGWLDELMTVGTEMASEKQTTYDRLQCILDFQYIRITILRRIINEFMISGNVSASEAGLYNPPEEADVQTNNPVGSSLFPTINN